MRSIYLDYLSELRMYPCFSNNGNNLDINISYENEETSRIIDYDNISKYFGINESVLSITNEIELICSLKKEVNKFINFSGTTIRYRKYDKLNYQNSITVVYCYRRINAIIRCHI